jgi:hypothetical protein
VLGLTSAQTLSFALPAGATRLAFEPDPTLLASASAVELIPDDTARPGLFGRSPRPLAAGSVSFGEIDLFVLDDFAYLEEGGLWTHGRASVAVVVSVSDGRSSATIAMSNGPVANAVSIRQGDRTRPVPLAPSERRSVAIPLGANGTADLRVESPSGFRPSEVGESQDRRLLGVWIGG